VDVKDGISVVRWSLNHNRCRTRRHDESVRKCKKLMEKESRITRLKMKNEEEAAEKRLQKRLGS
jgi:hypothetical protein